MLDLSKIHEAVRYEGGVSRRLFLAYGAAISALPLLAQRAKGRTLADPATSDNPFSLGVASGDPTYRGAALWTRLAPKPLEGGGMPTDVVEVRWEVADDDAMKNIVRSGVALAVPQLAHSVHVEVEGLKPDRPYWYRFHAAGATSPVGRTRTMPEPESMPAELRFAFASCQHFEQGLYTAYEQMAKDDPQIVFHLGDYIYEGAAKDGQVRKHVGGKLVSLDEYRNRHAQYRSDPLLSGMHALCPWIVTWDDHEVENNYATGISERKDANPADFLEQRANAYQAYYEMMPLRRRSLPRGPHMRLYRTIRFGRLAAFQVLDERQYRGDQPNDDKASDINDAATSSDRSMLGAAQADWLRLALLQSTATWNVLAQQVMMGMVDVNTGPDKRYSMDQWPGYAYERMRLVEFLAQRRVPNPVVLTGDIHANYVNDLRIDDRKPETPVVATELVGTSLCSGGNGQAMFKELDALLSQNPGLRYHNRQRGYVRCTLTPKTWQADYQIVSEVTKPGGTTSVGASFVIEAGQPGAKKA